MNKGTKQRHPGASGARARDPGGCDGIPPILASGPARRAGLIAMPLLLALGTPVLAKDAPRREPPRRVTECESQGEGFVRLEGSDTCVKVSGGVRAEFSTTVGRGRAGD